MRPPTLNEAVASTHSTFNRITTLLKHHPTTLSLLLLLSILPNSLTFTPIQTLSTYQIRHIHPSSIALDASDPKNRVDVCVTTVVPHIDPSTARKAWLDYTWKRGGGLLAVVLPIGDLESDAVVRDGAGEKEGPVTYPRKRRLLPLFAEEELVDNGADRVCPSGEGDDDDDDNNKKKKTVVGADGGNLGETALSNRSSGGTRDSIIVSYRLTRLGLWETEIEPNSHLGTVSFVSTQSIHAPSGTKITWTVTFATLRNNKLWETVTRNLISQATQNLASYLTPPLFLTVFSVLPYPSLPPSSKTEEDTDKTATVLATTTLPGSSTTVAAADTVLDRWLEYVWKKGGGLPLPLPPFALDTDFHRRMIVPPFLVERILSIDYSVPSSRNVGYRSKDIDTISLRSGAVAAFDAAVNPDNNHQEWGEILSNENVTKVCYTVDNPSLVTYPVHSHFGYVEFRRVLSSSLSNGEEDGTRVEKVDMKWTVAIRPMANLTPFVKFFTQTIVTALVKNLKMNLLVAEEEKEKEVFLSRNKDDGETRRKCGKHAGGESLQERRAKEEQWWERWIKPRKWWSVIYDRSDDSGIFLEWSDEANKTSIRQQVNGTFVAV